MTTNARARTGPLLAVLLAAQFMANVDGAVVNVAAPAIHADLHASGGELELVVSGYTLAYAMLLITGARLGDTHGYRRVFVLGLTVFTVASLACGLAPGAVVLIVARVVQGAGAALMVAQILIGIQQNFTGRARARALGRYAMTLAGAAVVGQILGGVLVSADLFGTGWRPIFVINVPIGILLIVAAMRCVPAGRTGGRRLDLRGVSVLSVASLLVVLPLVLGREEGWPAWTWVCLVAGLVGIGAFVGVERRVGAGGGYPLINLDVLARARVVWGLLAHALATATYLSMLFVLALYLQQGLGRSPLFSGLALVSWVAAFGIAGPLLPRIPRRVLRYVPVAGYLILGAGYLAISVGPSPDRYGGAVLIAMLGVGGFGLGIGFSSMIGHLTTAVPDRYAPDIGGVVTTVAQLGGVVGVATFGTLYVALAAGVDPSTAFGVTTAGFAAAALLAAAAGYLATKPGAASEPVRGPEEPASAMSTSR